MFDRAKQWLALILLAVFVHQNAIAATPGKPNVIVILADDLGWPDLGVQGATDLPTPHIDSLATNGVRFLNGYVTAPICSPSRAGFLTGRYQQRFGHEINPGPQLETDPVFGLPLTEATMGNRMKKLGYATGWIGKSHLGATEEYRPLERGFDEFFGFLEGHHQYKLPSNVDHDPILEGNDVVDEKSYLTLAFARECGEFIQSHANEPFFLYAPFNAVHFPLEAPDQLLATLDTNLYGGYTARYTNAAMLLALDFAVGHILTNLRALNIESNTLIFFSSDNGAPAPTGIDANGSVNTPLRGYKGSLYEGGIRVPFIVQWKGQVSARAETNAIVSLLDVVPTAITAAGGTIQPAWPLDGVNLMPLLLGATSVLPKRDLFWRLETAGGDGIPPGPRAVRSGDWKLVKPSRDANWELYDLATDIGEAVNLADLHPDVVRRLVASFDAWNAQNVTPHWDFNTRFYEAPNFVREDIRAGDPNISYLAPDFLSGAQTVAFQNPVGELWVGNLDPVTGFLISATGQDTRVDTGLPPLASSLDGPSWGLSTNGPAVFYTKTGTAGRLQIWRARTNESFTPTQVTQSQTNDSFSVRASQDENDPLVSLLFNAGTAAVSFPVTASESLPQDRTALTRPSSTILNGSWSPNFESIVYAGLPTSQSTVPQILEQQITTGVPRLLTTGTGNKTDAKGFLAAELDGEMVYAAVVNHTNISFYRDMRDNPGGYYSNFLSVAFPPAASMPYIYSLETLPGGRSFNGVSYFCFASHQNNDPQNPGDSGIWLLALGPDFDHHLIRRLDSDPTDADAPAVGGRRDPKIVAGANELFVYYSLVETSGVVQLRRARTGIKLPDHPSEPTGFSGLQFARSFSGGMVDTNNRAMNNSETTALVTHNGWLFAGQSSRMSKPYPTSFPPPDGWSGAQILVKTSPNAEWLVDYNSTNGPVIDPFPLHLRVDVLQNLQLTTPEGEREFLVAGMSDITSTGALAASARLRSPGGAWKHSHITTATEEAYPISLASHRDGSIRYIFTGLSNGQIHRGAYNAGDANLVWEQTHELREPGPVTGLAEANGILYATVGLAQSSPGALPTGGLYARDDASDLWTLVYRWPYPANLHECPPETGFMRGLTAAQDPSGAGRQVLLAGRAWPGVIERIDPANDHAATTELDVRDFFARKLGDDRLREQGVTIAYTGFTAATNPVTGEPIHLVGIWLDAPFFSGSHYLVRHRNGTYDAATIPNEIVGTELRGTRCIAVSPFTDDRDAVFYFGGYDPGENESHNTAWIVRGGWTQWPGIAISQPNPPEWQLLWPATSDDWTLESTSSLSNPVQWQAVSEISGRTPTASAVSLPNEASSSYFRLRKP